VDEAGRLGALGDDPVHVARERFESVDVGSAGDLIGLGAGQVAVLLFVLRRELHDRLGEVDRPVGPLVGVDIGVRVEPEIGGVGAPPQAGPDRDPVPEDDLQRDEVVLPARGVEGVVVVAGLGVLVGKVGNLRVRSMAISVGGAVASASGTIPVSPSSPASTSRPGSATPR